MKTNKSKSKKSIIKDKKIFYNLYDIKRGLNYKLSKSKINKKSIKKDNKTKKDYKKTKKLNLLKSLDKLKSIKNNQGYIFKELKDLESKHISGFEIKESLLNKLSLRKLPKNIKIVSEGYARGVSAYALQNYKLPNKTSNAYMKLWEIYNTVHNLMPNKKHVKVFHLAEAPGQWINCTRHYLETKKDKVEEYDWMANSLNSKHPSNIKKFGKGIFSDEYGLIKKYPDRWLYGSDNTGDITKGKNVKWFHNFVKEWTQNNKFKVDLITGDAGMGSGANVKLIDLQKIDYAQLCMTASIASKGSNCVLKHFSYLNMDFIESEKGSGFFISFLYLYNLMFEEVRLIKPLTSSPNSSEFYVVGLQFIGIDKAILNKLIDCLDNFKVNNAFFKKEEIPESFSKQIIEFLEKLYNLNNSQFDLVNMLLTCLVNPDPRILKETNCKKYLDQEFIKKFQKKKYKEWIKTYKFE